jgi:hypothetical protein
MPCFVDNDESVRLSRDASQTLNRHSGRARNPFAGDRAVEIPFRV